MVWVEVPRAALCAGEAVCEALVSASADAILLADPPRVAQVDGIRYAPLVSVAVVFVEEVAQHAWVLSGDEVVPCGAKGTVRIGVPGLEHVLAADAAAELSIHSEVSSDTHNKPKQCPTFSRRSPAGNTVRRGRPL
jgi:hypothetical protein